MRLGELRAAMVDLDGTLVDTLPDFDFVLNDVLRRMQLPAVPRSEIAQLVGKGSEHLIRSVLQRVGADGGRYEEAWATYQRRYLEVNGQHAEVFPGVVDGLRGLQSQGLRLACLTNKPSAFVRPLLEAKGLLGFFEVIRGGDDFPRKKPDPMPLLGTCEALGTEPARTLMIGDSSNDARAARAAGCPVVLVTYGYNHGEPVRGVDADGFVDSIEELSRQG